MLNSLKHIDETIFFTINNMHAPLFDQIMWLVSGGLIFLPLFIFIGIQVRKVKKTRALTAVLICVVLIILFCDQSSSLVKQSVQRYRPTHNLLLKEKVHTVNEYKGGQFGFFSGHAANTFG